MSDKIQTIDPGRVVTKEQQSDMLAAANMLAKSDLIPESFRGRPANCALALDYAQRLGVAPLFVMQNLYTHRGRIGWQSDFVHGMLRKSKVLRGPIKYEERGTPYEADYGMRCWGVDAETGEEVHGVTWITPGLVHRNGWDKPGKNGTPANWTTQPEVMYPRRAATYLCREHYPEVLMGLPTQDEILDILVEEEREVREASANEDAELAALARSKREKAYDEADVVDVTPEPEPEPEDDAPLDNVALDEKIVQEEAEAAARQAELGWE